MVTRTFFIIAGLLILRASSGSAQGTSDGGPDPSKVRVKIGPFWMNPTMSLTNMGVDTNVFNEADDQSPKRDFTFTFTPQTEVWVRMGPTWMNGTIREDIVWYQKYATERSGNDSYSLGWKAPFNRLSLSVNGSWLNARDRPGFEIDARSQRKETKYEGTVELRALTKTFFGVIGGRQSVNFDKAAVFLGNSLQDGLNRTSTSAGLTLRNQLTPLTSITFTALRQEDRFEFSSLRNANSTSFSGSVKFDPAALLKGTATFGYRDFEPSSPGLPNYKGTTAMADLSYSVFGTTKFDLTATRDVQYSYDVNQPYYVQSGLTGSVSQQIFGPFDATVRGGAQQLDYRDRAGAVLAASNRVDRVRSYGGGVGYHFGKDTRIGFNVDQQKRSSAVSSRQFSGLRYGTSVTYGS
jgi:hypothetical protein